jgi:putative acetyltransferase
LAVFLLRNNKFEKNITSTKPVNSLIYFQYKEERVFFMEIKIDDLTGTEVVHLIGEHLHSMTLNSPPESIHALNLDQLRRPEITFWSAWEGKELLGFGALKELDEQHGEIKSMRTSSAHLRKGVASRILIHLIEEAKQRGYNRLSLETGSMDAFEPARRLYASFGFHYCEPFSDYLEDPNSVFMTMELKVCLGGKDDGSRIKRDHYEV